MMPNDHKRKTCPASGGRCSWFNWDRMETETCTTCNGRETVPLLYPLEDGENAE
jgi:hypothetical protein